MQRLQIREQLSASVCQDSGVFLEEERQVLAKYEQRLQRLHSVCKGCIMLIEDEECL